MSKIIETITQAKTENNPQLILALIPFAGHMGVEAFIEKSDSSKQPPTAVSSSQEDKVISKLRFNNNLIGDMTIPAIHGGAIGSLLESAAIINAIWASETPRLPKTINITVEYLRSGKPQDTFATGFITKFGRRVINVRALAWQEDFDKPIAAANAHFLIKE